jgi:flagellar hook-length control protein FliK
MISTTSVPPVSLPTALTEAKLHVGKSKDLWGSLFSSVLAAANGSALMPTALSSTSTGTNLTTQLTSGLQRGLPLSTIVDRLSQGIGSAAATQLQGSYSPSELAQLRGTITQTIANALSPPSNAPPGDAAQEAATLAARLQSIVESIARDATTGTGQQNELSGSNLDANSAKEAPAQQTNNNGTSSQLDAASLARSLMASALSALTASSAAASSTAAQLASASQSVATNLATTTNAADLTALTGATSQSAAPATQQTTANTAPPQQTAGLTMANAPDLLARMLVRAGDAAGQTAADAASTVAGDAADAASGAASAVASAAASAAGSLANLPTLSPSAMAAKFAALIADASAGGVTAGSSSGNAQMGFGSGHSFDQSSAQQTPSGATLANMLAAPAGSLASQVQNALQDSVNSYGSAIDTDKIVEQMVNGMAMRSLAQGTSEIRLQLQPENLGQVTMRLSVSGNQVNANVVAQNADVGNALIASHRDLARSLSQAGLTLSGFSVDVSGGDAGRDQSNGRSGGFGRRFTVHELGGADVAAEATESSNLGPSILYGSKLELFNSLA